MKVPMKERQRRISEGLRLAWARKKTESQLKDQCLHYLRSLKWMGEPIWYAKLHGSPMQQAGLPDLLIIYRGHTFAVELKRLGKEPTKLQRRTLDEISKAGATVAVVCDVEELKAILVNWWRTQA